MSSDAAPSGQEDASIRERLRARLYLQTILPLLRLVVAEKPAVGRLVRGLTGTVQFEARGFDYAARLHFHDETLDVVHGPPEDATLRFIFPDVSQMNDFFAGKPRLPRISPWFGLGHPILLMRSLQLLMALRILEPPADSSSWPDPDERALRVRLLLYLVTNAIERLHRDGFAAVEHIAAESPDRVYQWTVEGTDIAAWLRMCQGRVKSGRGTYANRRPFVHFVFPDVDAAFGVLTATESQMHGFRGGRVVTYGSPEYTRKMALLMQEVDVLLMEG